MVKSNGKGVDTEKKNEEFLFRTGLFLYPIPVGHLIDLTNSNRFTYGRFMHVDAQGNVQRSNRFSERHFRQYHQGSTHFLIALPYINFFHLNHPHQMPRNFGGLIGGGLGVQHFYADNRSWVLRGDAITSLPPLIVLPIVMMVGGDMDSGSALNVSITDNFHINRFQLGYGVNFARNTKRTHGYWKGGWGYEESVWIPRRRNTNNMLGMALSAHYRLTNHFHIGVIYRPSFIELSRIRPMYEHSISIDFMWRL